MSSVAKLESESKRSVSAVADDLGIRLERIETVLDLMLQADRFGAEGHLLSCLLKDAQKIQDELYEIGGAS